MFKINNSLLPHTKINIINILQDRLSKLFSNKYFLFLNCEKIL